MRRLSLTVLLLAAPVLAQEAAEPSAPPSPAAAAPQEAPPPAPEPAAQPPAPEAPAQEEAAPAPAEAAPPARKRRSKPAPKPAAKAVKPAPAPKAPAPKAAEVKAPEPAAPEKVAEPAPPAPAPEPASPGTLSPRERVAEEARVFFALLLTGDVRTLSFRLDFPFQLEGRRFGDNEELVSEWVRSLRQRRTDLVTLYDIEVLTPEEMERKHGAPPKRLGTLDYRGPNTYVAVANLSGRAAVAVFRISQGAVKAVAYTD